MNYKESGVDIKKTDNLVKEISGLVDNIGGFGGLFDLGNAIYTYTVQHIIFLS